MLLVSPDYVIMIMMFRAREDECVLLTATLHYLRSVGHHGSSDEDSSGTGTALAPHVGLHLEASTARPEDPRNRQDTAVMDCHPDLGGTS